MGAHTQFRETERIANVLAGCERVNVPPRGLTLPRPLPRLPRTPPPASPRFPEVPVSLAQSDPVIFDIDGTLLATDRFWLEVGRRAVRTVYDRHGVDRELPSDRTFLAPIGMSMEVFWQNILPEDLHHLCAEVEGEAQDLEEAAFARGVGAMYPGALALIRDLHADGRRVSLASNCGLRYLKAFMAAFDLAPLLESAYCIDSPGIRSKADMIGEIVAGTDARRAVMIGDRDSDRAAARAHGVPFILFAGGFDAIDPVSGDAVARTYDELRELLRPPASTATTA